MITQAARSVLIVEDERIVAKHIQQTLAELGYDAFAIASSGDEAIARASEKCPDVVLMDIKIKGPRDGVETAEILRQRFGVPVVYLTSHADDVTVERAKKTEPFGYLLKPVQSAALRSVIEVALYRHQMEQRLRERERWFATTLGSIADAVVAVDLSGRITFMNRVAEELTGSKAQESVGKPVGDVLRLIDAQEKALEAPLVTALSEQRTLHVQETSLLNISTGTRVLIGHSAAPVMDGDRSLGAVMVFRDVTEQTKLQKQLEFADRLAALGTMAAGIAHEVNNPLAVVVGNTEFVIEEMSRYVKESQQASAAAGDARLREITRALSDLQAAGSRIARIVADLHGFSRPVVETLSIVDVTRCIEWAVRTTLHEFQYRAQVRTHLGTVPQVRAEEVKLGQVLINLLVNAAHSIAPGSVDRNEVTVTTRTDETGRAVIEIRDTGAGIPSDLLTRIFEPFFTTETTGVGTGLGLSICHGIVRSFGGTIDVESQVGEGTVFRVFLPAAVSDTTVRVEPPAISGPANLRRRRLLVVDDEDMVLRMIERTLSQHQVTCVQSAKEALALIEQGEAFDVVLSDVMMPSMTGIELYETLLAHKPDLARRVVFMSGGAVTQRVEDFLRSVNNPRIGKPFEAATLRDAVQQLLSEREIDEVP